MTLTCFEKITLVAVVAIALRVLLRIGILVWKKLIAPKLGFGINWRSQGRWAVVTGGSSGIGKAYAEQLAEKGLDIVLVSRSLSKLEEVAAEIKKRYGVEVRVLDVDLSEGQAAYGKISKATEELEIAVIVNNAGASYEYPEYFTKVSEETLATILQLNVAATTGVARVLLPRMYERRKGVLINISSGLAVIPSPYLTVYAASKAYIVKLSEDLAAESSSKGVTVQCVIPGPVATKMAKIKKATWMAPSAEQFVQAALKTTGIESLTTAYPPHFLFITFMRSFRCICEKGALWLVTKQMFNIKSRAMRKEKNSDRKEGEDNPLNHESLE